MIHGVSALQTWAVVGSAPGRGGGGIVAAESSRLRNAGEIHTSAGCHTLKKPIRQAMQISEAPISTIQGLTKLEIKYWGTAKGHPADEDRGPDLNHAPPAGKGADQPGRHDQRKERQLPPDDGTEQVGVEPGDAGETRNRRTERAKGDGRGVGDEREARGRERREAEPDQHSRSDRDRRAKTGGTFEKSPKGKGDQQELQSAIRRYSANGLLQSAKGAGRHGQPVHEDEIEDDPADWEEAEDCAEDRGSNCTPGRHWEQENV